MTDSTDNPTGRRSMTARPIPKISYNLAIK
jgi:hypothetical protein